MKSIYLMRGWDSNRQETAIVLAKNESDARACMVTGSDSVWHKISYGPWKIGEIDISFNELPYEFCHSYSGGGYCLSRWISF